jgi:leader peptidase (prepilin peptidase)/N-methyltransferase
MTDLSGFGGATIVALQAAAFILGLTLGSFLNVVIFRLPREGLAVDRPRRSFCPVCAAKIVWTDNIPVFSWLWLKGRCRYCQAPISWRYPLVELVAAFLSLFVFQAEGLTVRYAFTLYFLLCLTAVAFIDLEHMVIPDILVIPTIFLGVALAVVDPNPLLTGFDAYFFMIELGWSPRLIGLVGAVSGFVLGFGLLFLVATGYKAWRGRTGLGDGDPPLLGLIGVFLGWLSIFPILFLSTILALLSVGGLLLLGRFPSGARPGLQPIPFGPFLSLAALIWYFFGQAIVRWYQGLLAF